MGRATEMIESLDALAHNADRVSLGELDGAVSHRSQGALLAVPALLELSPVGAVPGVPTTLALVVTLFAMQIALGRDRMWLPGWLSRRTVSGPKLRNAVQRLRPVAEWLDTHLGLRLHRLVDKAGTRLAALAVITLCLTVPPLELVPLASSIPMSVIALFGLAIVLRDGLAMAVAWAAFAAAITAVVAILT